MSEEAVLMKISKQGPGWGYGSNIIEISTGTGIGDGKFFFKKMELYEISLMPPKGDKIDFYCLS